MELTVVQSMWQGFRIDSLPVDHILDINPEPGFPHGREAKLLCDVWYRIRDTDIKGLLLLGCDIAADPDDYQAMRKAVSYYPMRVLTGMVKLWPASTGRESWMWSHRGGRFGHPVASQQSPDPVTYFSLGFLWAPRQLLDLAGTHLRDCSWGEFDVKLSELAYENRIVVAAVDDCKPKHLHFTEAHNR